MYLVTDLSSTQIPASVAIAETYTVVVPFAIIFFP